MKNFVDLFFLEKKFCEKFLGAKKSAHLALKATNKVISCDFKILIMIIKKCRVPAGSMSGFGYWPGSENSGRVGSGFRVFDTRIHH